MERPLVSICCITYNHAPFIRQCLDGFLMQQCVDYEILIHDDCSTDGTTEIIREYAEKYPDIIKPLYENESLFRKVGLAGIDVPNYARVQGKYIAYCEGDDYWTDPFKLQKQVDFMEAHPEYSVCFTTFRNYVVDRDEYRETEPTKILQSKGNPDEIDVDTNQFFAVWHTQPMTMLIRQLMFDITWREQYQHYRDQHEIYHLLKAGKGRLLNFDSGVRNMHSGGVASMIQTEKQLLVSEEISEELFKYHRDKPTKEFYRHTLLWVLSYTKPFSIKRLGYAWRVLMLDGNVWHFCKHIYRQFNHT